MPSHLLREVEHFFATCEPLEGADVVSEGWGDAAEARDVVERAVRAWSERAQKKALPGRSG